MPVKYIKSVLVELGLPIPNEFSAKWQKMGKKYGSSNKLITLSWGYYHYCPNKTRH
jgi:hypothetical protein